MIVGLRLALAAPNAAVTSRAPSGVGATPAESTHSDSVRPLLISLRGAAALLNVSVRSVQRLVSAGDLAPVRVRRRMLIPMQELDAYVATLRLGNIQGSGERPGRPSTQPPHRVEPAASDGGRYALPASWPARG